MEQKVTITIHAAETHYTVGGFMEQTPAGTRLVYDEPAALEMGRVTSVLTVEETRAVLTRSGTVRSELRFEPGAPHSSIYETPHGSFPAEVVTHSLRSRLDARGGLIDLRYTLTVGGAADEHRLKILVRTEDEE